MSSIFSCSLCVTQICLALIWAELNRKQSSSSVPFSLHFSEESACKGETRDDAWMLPKLSFILETKRLIWGWDQWNWVTKRKKGPWKKHLQLFNLLSWSQGYKTLVYLQNRGIKERLQWLKWLLNADSITERRQNVLLNFHWLTLFQIVYNRWQSLDVMYFVPCNSCEEDIDRNVKEIQVVATVPYDQEKFQNSKYFLVLKLNWVTVTFILQFYTQRLWETNRNEWE